MSTQTTEMPGRRTSARLWWRRVGRGTATLFVGVATVVGIGAAGTAMAVGDVYRPRDGRAPAVSAGPAQPAALDPQKPTVAIVVGPEGANVADTLAPYEVLASTEDFNVYIVAAQREPVTLTGGLDIIPDLTFEQLDNLLPAGADVIVVPQLQDPTGPSVAPIVDWIRRQRAEGHPLLMSVCVGAEVLASAGMLEGRAATAHWLGLIGLRRNYPEVDWRDGVRYVDDDDLITTGAVLSGVDGALRVIERLVGPAAAEHAAAAVHWPDYSPGGDIRIQRSLPAPADLVALLSAGFRSHRPSMGVLLTDGIGEIELASAFRPYTELSYLARPLAVSVDGRPIRSRHGLLFVPRADLSSAARDLDRLVVPGADAAQHAGALRLPDGLTPVYLHDRPGFAFDGALQDIAATYDVATAQWVAKSMQYPTAMPQLSGAAWPLGLTLRPILIAAGAIALTILAIRPVRRRRTTAVVTA